jgi:neutral ceramidase
VQPQDLSGEQTVHTQIDDTGVVNDGPGLTSYGSLAADVDASYVRGPGAVAQATFWSAHPRNVVDLQRSGDLATYYPDPETFSYLDVQRQEASGWVTVAADASPATTLRWERVGLSIFPESNTTVSYPLRDAEPGQYRLVHHGIAKETVVGLLPRYKPYTGTSGEFTVQ